MTKLSTPCFRPIVHSSPAVRAGQLLFTSGVLGIPASGDRLVEKFSDLDEVGRSFATGMPSVDGWIEAVGAQFWQTMQNLDSVLTAGGSALSNIALLSFYSMQMQHHHLINTLRSTAFRPSPAPPNTGLQPSNNPAGALMQASAVGFIPDQLGGWARRLIRSGDGSQSMSHYDLGVQIGPLLVTGDFVPGSKTLRRAVRTYDDVKSFPSTLRPAGSTRNGYEETVRAQTWFLYETIKDVLAQNGTRLEDIARLRVYLVDVADVVAFIDVHRTLFGQHRPVMTLSMVDKLGRADFRVAIEVMAVVPGVVSESNFQVRFLSPTFEGVLGLASGGVEIGPYIFLGNCACSSRGSGAALDPRFNESAIDHSGSLGVDLAFSPAIASALRALEQGHCLLKAAGASLSDVVSLNIFLSSIHDLPAVDQVLRHFFPKNPPAVTIIESPALAIPGSRVDMEITAYKRSAQSR